MLTYVRCRVGHYQKALNEDAINGQAFKHQWPRHWTESPLARGGTFHTLTHERRLDLLKTLTLWALGHSDAIKAIINSNYTGKRTNDDLNQPLSVQPWGFDSDKRRYFLVEGDDNCSFRVYRESNPAALYNRQWISVAGSIDQVKALAGKLATADGGPNARKLSSNITKNIANFEEKEEKRKRREYRRQQKERFRRPEPGFSMYEGRTRGKRVKYTYSDEEDFYTDSTNRRSTRNTRNHSPAEAGPIVTASGRQSRPPARLNADALSNGDASAAPSVQGDNLDTEMSEAAEVGPTGRPRRSAAAHGTNGSAHPRKRRHDYVSDEEDEDESEPDLGDDEEEHVPDEDEFEDEEEFENDAMDMDEDDQAIAADSPGSNDSRVVKLPIKVKIDKNGKVKRLLMNGDTPSASAPSNIASSPSAAEGSSEDSPSDVPNYEPERTEDVVNVVPLKRSEPKPATVQPPAITSTNGDSKPPQLTSAVNGASIDTSAGSVANPPASTPPSKSGQPSNTPATTLPASTIAAGASEAPTSTPEMGTTTQSKSRISSTVLQTPSTPMGGAASLAFRGSPEKNHPTPPAVMASGSRE